MSFVETGEKPAVLQKLLSISPIILDYWACEAGLMVVGIQHHLEVARFLNKGMKGVMPYLWMVLVFPGAESLSLLCSAIPC